MNKTKHFQQTKNILSADRISLTFKSFEKRSPEMRPCKKRSKPYPECLTIKTYSQTAMRMKLYTLSVYLLGLVVLTLACFVHMLAG